MRDAPRDTLRCHKKQPRDCWRELRPAARLGREGQPPWLAAGSTIQMKVHRIVVDMRQDQCGPTPACGTNGAENVGLHLMEISTQGAHAVVTLDGAGWHQQGEKLKMPDNISLLPLPPFSPELNPQENIWRLLRQNDLANRVYETYAELVDACCEAWMPSSQPHSASLPLPQENGRKRSPRRAAGISQNGASCRVGASTGGCRTSRR